MWSWTANILIFLKGKQCCGSGSGIGCLFDPWILDGRKSVSGSGIRDEQPGSYFLELRNHFFAFWGVKILKFFDEDPGWRQFGSGIRDGKKSDPGCLSRIRNTEGKDFSPLLNSCSWQSKQPDIF